MSKIYKGINCLCVGPFLASDGVEPHFFQVMILLPEKVKLEAIMIFKKPARIEYSLALLIFLLQRKH